MSNKGISIYFFILAFLYLGYTVLIVGHGLHWTNTLGFIFVVALAMYFYFKGRIKN